MSNDYDNIDFCLNTLFDFIYNFEKTSNCYRFRRIQTKNINVSHIKKSESFDPSPVLKSKMKFIGINKGRFLFERASSESYKSLVRVGIYNKNNTNYNDLKREELVDMVFNYALSELVVDDPLKFILLPIMTFDTTINKLSKVSSQLATKFGRRPKISDIAKEMELDVSKVNEIIRIAQRAASLEAPIGEEKDSKLGDIIPDEYSASPTEIATWASLKKQINEILSGLTDREKKVLELRFGLKDGVSRTLEEVGHEFKVTRERIRQIEAKALKRLKNDEIAQALRDYLK